MTHRLVATVDEDSSRSCGSVPSACAYCGTLSIVCELTFISPLLLPSFGRVSIATAFLFSSRFRLSAGGVFGSLSPGGPVTESSRRSPLPDMTSLASVGTATVGHIC